MELSPSWKPTGSQLVNKLPAFYETQRFIIAFTIARHLSLSWARSNQSTPPHPNSWRSSYIILPSTSVSSKWSSFRFTPKHRVYNSPLSHTCYMLGPNHYWIPHRSFISNYCVRLGVCGRQLHGKFITLIIKETSFLFML